MTPITPIIPLAHRLDAIEKFLDRDHPGWRRPRRCSAAMYGARCQLADDHQGPHEVDSPISGFHATWPNAADEAESA
jgi:hypothetical protein